MAERMERTERAERTEKKRKFNVFDIVIVVVVIFFISCARGTSSTGSLKWKNEVFEDRTMF